jgi:cysteine desulfurase family protein (TIGR01976 family)
LECQCGIYLSESKKADQIIFEGRKAVADLLNAPSPDTIVSGESATSLLFSLSYAIGKSFTGSENIVTTHYEHYANISPWLELKERGLVHEVRFAHLIKDEGILDMEHMKSLVDDKTKVIAVTATSNVLGTKTLLKDVGKLAHEADAYFIVDAVHHLPHGLIDVKAVDCDFLVFSGYKFFTSHGSFLYGKKEHLETLKPYKVEPAPDHPPNKFELGTRDQSKFAAIKAVIDYHVWIAEQVADQYNDQLINYSGRVRFLKVAMKAIEEYEKELSKAMLTGFDDTPGLTEIPGVKVYGLKDESRLDERDPTFAFKVEDVTDEEVVEKLWVKYGIAARAENYYSKVPEVYGVPSMIRVTLVHYNTLEEVCTFLKALNEICVPVTR